MLKHCRKCIKHEACGQDTNKVQGKAKCYILRKIPARQCFNYFKNFTSIKTCLLVHCILMEDFVLCVGRSKGESVLYFP